MSEDDAQWWMLARNLELSHCEPGDYLPGTAFAQVVRSRGEAVEHSISQRHWIHGRHDGVEVIVCAQRRAGAHPAAFPEIVHTLAGIDPPGMVRILVTPQQADAWLVLPATEGLTRHETGDAWFDAHYMLYGSDPRIGRLFDEVVPTLRELGGRDMLVVTDSAVDIASHNVESSVHALERRVGLATSVAAALRARLRLLRDRRWHKTLERKWARVAAARRLVHDTERFALDGLIGNVHTRIALEMEPSGCFTSLVLDWPRPLGVDLDVVRGRPLGFVDRLRGRQDVVVGDPSFDAMFLVRGASDDPIRRLFADRAITAAFVALASAEDVLGVAQVFRLTDTRLVVRWPRCVEEGAALETILAPVHAIDHAWFAATSGGPYR